MIQDSLSLSLIKKLKRIKLKVIYTDVYYKDKYCYDFKSLMKKSDIIIFEPRIINIKQLKCQEQKFDRYLGNYLIMKKLNFIFVGGKKLGYETLNFLPKKF